MKNSNTILGICPGTRSMGMAVMRDSELLDYRMKSFNEKWSKQKLIMILGGIKKEINRWGVRELRWKSIPQTHQTKSLKEIKMEVQRLCKLREILFREVSSKEMLSNIPKEEKKNKRNLALWISKQYPELLPILKKEMENRNKYYHKIFEAVGILNINF